jgi:hypothetical protein
MINMAFFRQAHDLRDAEDYKSEAAGACPSRKSIPHVLQLAQLFWR